jgi:hypothetical protein
MNPAPPSSSNISPERLNQIAGRKLASLGILVRLTADRKTLEGEYIFKTGQVQFPGAEAPIQRGRFIVRGHDHLRFVEAPLAALGDVMFYDLDRPAAVEERVAQALRARLQELERPAAELKRLRLPFKLDPQRLGLRTVVKTAQHTFEMLALPSETRVLKVEPLNGRGFEVDTDHPPLRLSDFRLLVDLELFLSTDVNRMKQQQAAAGAAPAPQVKVEPVPPAAGQLTLGMLVQRFGADTVLSEHSELELVQDFQVGPTRYRLAMTRENGSNFRVALNEPAGEKQAELMDMSKFPGAGPLVASWLRASQAAAGAQVAQPTTAVPQHLLPHAGEVWVMNVLIEEESGEEIRYVCTDTDGRPYGAARILKRPDFESAFVRHSASGWRLLILIDEVQADSVIYRQLDGQRQPRGQPRKLASGVLVATFLPEAAAY